MPASIRISSGYFKRETFEVWDAASDTFGPDVITGRKKRIDAFVSLWHRSSRRDHIYVLPGTPTANLAAMRSVTTGNVYLVSQSSERDTWQKNGNVYEVLLRCHKATSPSGGKALHYPVTVAGSGDDLGPVIIGPPVAGWADTELRSTGDAEDTVRVASNEYFLAYSRNFATNDGDYIETVGSTFLLMETNYDSGYLYARAKREQPLFHTVEFKIPSTTPAVFDPISGRMTGSSEVSRQVSAYVAEQTRSGSLPAHTLTERVTLYIYLRHIGFTPLLGHGVILNGVRYTIDGVRQNLDDKQWHLDLSR